MSFARYMGRLLPGYLSLAAGPGRLLDAWGAAQDEARSAVMAMRRQWFPAFAMGWALAELGQQRGLRQLAGQSEAGYRAVVVDAFALHQQGGTAPGMVRGLGRAGLGEASVHEHFRDLVRLDGARSLDGSWRLGPYSGAEFSLQMSVPAGGVTPQWQALARAVARRHKPAHTRLRELRLVAEGARDDVGVTDSCAAWAAVGMADSWGLRGHRLDGSWFLGGSVSLDTADDHLDVTTGGGGWLVD